MCFSFGVVFPPHLTPPPAGRVSTGLSADGAGRDRERTRDRYRDGHERGRARTHTQTGTETDGGRDTFERVLSHTKAHARVHTRTHTGNDFKDPQGQAQRIKAIFPDCTVVY